MAGIDYCTCHECGKRLFYDGERIAREYMFDNESSKYLICSKCYEKLTKKLNKIEKRSK